MPLRPDYADILYLKNDGLLRFLNAARVAVALDVEGGYLAAPVSDYADENVSAKLAKIIQSYTGVVDRMVWKKG